MLIGLYKEGKTHREISCGSSCRYGKWCEEKTYLSVIFQLEISIYLLPLLKGKESPHRAKKVS